MYEHYRDLLKKSGEEMLEIAGTQDIDTVLKIIKEDIQKLLSF